MGNQMDELKTNVKARTMNIRLRTWTLTIAIILSMVFYFLVNVIFKNKINVIDFVFLAVVQILGHCLYFPEGDIYGQKDSAYINNKKAYNEKATKINSEHKIKDLGEYCKFEFKQRKKRYVEIELGYLCLTEKDFNLLSQKSPEEIKKIKSFVRKAEKEGEEDKTIHFNRKQRRRLYNLIFEPIPVEPNQPETIMSALENNGKKAIRDESIPYRTGVYIKKFLLATVVGLFFAYVGYTLRDGITLADITRIFVYVTTLFSTVVLSFTSGETCSKVYKKNFYINLANFIDGFFEWENNGKN